MSILNLLILYNDKLKLKTVQPFAPPSDQNIVITHDHEHEDNYRGNNDDHGDDNNV